MAKFEIGKRYTDRFGNVHTCTNRTENGVYFDNGHRRAIKINSTGNECTTTIVKDIDISAREKATDLLCMEPKYLKGYRDCEKKYRKNIENAIKELKGKLSSEEDVMRDRECTSRNGHYSDAIQLMEGLMKNDV